MTAIQRAVRPTGALVGIGAGVLTLGALVATAADEGLVLCPFRRCTGGYCPGCGSTRAVRELVGADVAAAWAQSPWVVLAAVQAAVVLIVAGLTGAGAVLTRAKQLALRLLWPNVALLLGIWVFRLVDGSIPRFW